jgi:DNA-directed RNA polymerase
MRTTYGTGEVDTSKSKISFAPNFIHSCDASHLTATVNSFDGDILSVHDSYSTVACDIDELHVKLREAFYNLYKDGDVLDKIKVELEQRFDIELPPPPTKGSYDISCVLNSTYFFS